MPETVFFVGCSKPGWLSWFDRPLFLSYSSLEGYGDLPVAQVECAEDSRGFVELGRHGRWTVPARKYARDVERHQQQLGPKFRFACVQDWMVELEMLRRTGLTVEEHQRRTLNSYLELRSLAPHVRWAVALQGWEEWQYLEHLERYLRAGVDPWEAPRVVLGTMCKRQATDEAARIVRKVAGLGLPVHPLGFKTLGLRQVYGDTDTDPTAATSGDSCAGSYAARRRHYIHPGCQHGEREFRELLGREEYGNCANCPEWTRWWADDVVRFARTGVRVAPPGVEHRPRPARRARVQLAA